MSGKKRAANASKNARILPIGVDYIDWINYIFITQSQLALKAAAAAASASALIKFAELWNNKIRETRGKPSWKRNETPCNIYNI